MIAHARVVAERNLPDVLARREVDGSKVAVRRLVQRERWQARAVTLRHAQIQRCAAVERVPRLDRVRHRRLDQAEQRRLIRALYVEYAGCRIECAAAPAGAADHARHRDRALQRRWQEQLAMTPPPQLLQPKLLQLRRKIDHIVLAETLFREWCRFLRERLRECGTFSRYIAR